MCQVSLEYGYQIDLSVIIATTAKDVLSRSGLSDDTLAKVW